MNSIERQSDSEWDSILREWSADEVPDDFATRVVLAARGGQAIHPSPKASRSLGVPLLLVAIFVSVGAAAAWDRYERRQPIAGPGAASQGDAPGARPSRLSFHLVSDDGRAEREETATASTKAAKGKRIQTPNVLISAVDEATVDTKPRVVHWPKCECGTSGVVCACSD